MADLRKFGMAGRYPLCCLYTTGLPLTTECLSNGIIGREVDGTQMSYICVKTDELQIKMCAEQDEFTSRCATERT